VKAGSKNFFFGKKKQKTFVRFGAPWAARARLDSQSLFAAFSPEKEEPYE
jgi:hypothetical protein